MRKLVAFALLLGMSFTQLANASVSSNEETFIMHGCDKCDKKDCKGSCDKKNEKACKKGKKRSCCKKGKSCKKKEEKKKAKEEVK
tara:strand:+ start:1444 stop:1698 length:255 start_codon:yes stop_codon:yes gene_type:complete